MRKVYAMLHTHMKMTIAKYLAVQQKTKKTNGWTFYGFGWTLCRDRTTYRTPNIALFCASPQDFSRTASTYGDAIRRVRTNSSFGSQDDSQFCAPCMKILGISDSMRPELLYSSAFGGRMLTKTLFGSCALVIFARFNRHRKCSFPQSSQHPHRCSARFSSILCTSQPLQARSTS